VAPTGSRRHQLLQRLRRSSPRRLLPPRVTLLLPIDGADTTAVRTTITSLLTQTDPRWELLLAGERTDAYADVVAFDPRVRPAEVAGDLAAQLNAAAQRARGAYVGAIGAGDEVLPRGIRAMARALVGRRVDVIYGDETDLAKPDWSPDLLLAFPYTGRLCLFRRDAIVRLGGWRSDSVAAEDYRLVLAAARLGCTIRRVARPVYSRVVPARTALTSAVALPARRAALEEHLAAIEADAAVLADPGHAGLRVRWAIDGQPLVSIVIATRDRLSLLRQCIKSIEARSSYAAREIVIVDNDSREPETLEYFAACGYKIVPSPGVFNFSRINNDGARAAAGDYVIFLNNDTEVISPGWIEEMLQYAQRNDVACVGAKLLFGDGRVQHAGVILHDGSAYHLGYGERVTVSNWPNIDLVRNFAGVTAACLMIRRQRFLDEGGLDESFPVNYNDVELCIRLLRRGYRHVYTPHAVLFHHESSSRPAGVAASEGRHLRAVAGALLWNDPFCPRTEVRGTPRWTLRPGGGETIARLARVSSRAWQALLASRWRRRPLLGIRPSSSVPDNDSIRWIDRVDIGGEIRPALFMHPKARRTFPLTTQRGAEFRSWVSLMPETWDKNHGGVTFRASITVDGKVVRSREWRIDPSGVTAHRRWVPVTLPFASAAGRPAELVLETETPPDAGPQYGWAVWGDPGIAERRSTGDILSRQVEIVRQLGPRAAAIRYARMLRGAPPHHFVLYDAWFHEQAAAARRDPDHLRAELDALACQPLISVLTPVYNTPPELLRRMVQSVRDQLYPHWELCLADDASPKKETQAALASVSGADPRIRIVRLAANGGISAATNAALAAARGEFVALLDHDDELTADALLEVVKALNTSPDADVVYTDEDKLDFDGTHVEPFFKPDWSPDYLRSTMYLGHLVVYRRSILEEAGRFRSAFDGSQDYDVALRVTERTDRVVHVPRVAYHWRKTAGSAAGDTEAKPWGLQAARRALADHVSRLPRPATIEDQPGDGFWRVRYEVAGSPLVSVIIPTDGRVAQMVTGPRDLPLECIKSIVDRTDYPNYEIVLVDNGRLSSELQAYIAQQPRIRRAIYDATGPFNFANKVNFSARHAKGEHLLLLNDDTEVISPEWMRAMLEFSQQPEVGAVGAKLLFPDGRLQHVGVVLGIGGGACHVFSGHAGNTPGYFGSAWVIRNYSAVTGACCMTRRDVFDALGGFDERFATDFNDVDYCLRVRAKGLRIVATPFARLYHFEGATFGSREHVVNPAEVALLSERWGSVIAHDPYYNPNLTRTALDYSLRL
jgi:GT2 family glycosyltransferase